MSQSKKKNSKKGTQFAPYFRRGTELLHRGEVDKAVRILEKANQLEPDHEDAAINLSGGYILQKKFKTAVSILEPLTILYPSNAMIWTNLGAAYLGNPVLASSEAQLRAIDAFKKALKINPAAPNVAYNLGLIYRDRKETENAIKWFQKAVQTNPMDADARRVMDRLKGQDS